MRITEKLFLNYFDGCTKSSTVKSDIDGILLYDEILVVT